MTSKLQVTVPKALAEQYGIAPGSEIEWQPAGDSLRVVPPSARTFPLDMGERLRLFDAATERARRRGRRRRGRGRTRPSGRGWTREEIYDRGRPR
ncbi:MAG: AbrB/MazE/SpoVT family DNA-binding domain-containing protein [Planctomycetes bacterium]|nr:AbrB/MazE/SpoVT family DNA-binding domain-containing protein [Planctomycetota bacterium]